MSDLIVVKDEVAEKLDEMADLCEYWKKHRRKGRTPNAIKEALVMLSEEVVTYRSIGINTEVFK